MTTFQFANNFLTVEYDSKKDSIVLEATLIEGTWFGVGFGNSMIDTDMIVWQANGKDSKAIDLWSDTYAQPQEDVS